MQAYENPCLFSLRCPQRSSINEIIDAVENWEGGRKKREKIHYKWKEKYTVIRIADKPVLITTANYVSYT